VGEIVGEGEAPGEGEGEAPGEGEGEVPGEGEAPGEGEGEVPGEGEGEVPGEGDGEGEAAHVALVMVLESNVTAPFRARVRPFTTVALVFSVIDVKARMFPLKAVFVPRVAELPTCQKTLHAWVPLMRFTLLADAVVRVDPIWKMKTALGSPWPSSVTVPVS
jgi:hypothetical protein